MGNLMDMAFKGKWYSPALKGGYKIFAHLAKRKARQKEFGSLPKDK
jgi:hypothetical protein